MASSKTLMALRDIQRMRQAREEALHATAIRDKETADAALQGTQALLNSAEQDLAQDFERSEFQLDRFRILTARISEIVEEIDARREELGQASAVEEEAHTARRWAERQTEHLEERHSVAARNERRRSDDLTARDYMSALAAFPRRQR